MERGGEGNPPAGLLSAARRKEKTAPTCQRAELTQDSTDLPVISGTTIDIKIIIKCRWQVEAAVRRIRCICAAAHAVHLSHLL